MFLKALHFKRRCSFEFRSKFVAKWKNRFSGKIYWLRTSNACTKERDLI